MDSLDSAETDDKHHSEALEWHFLSRLALLNNQRPPNDWFAYFPTWARGNLKSTTGEDIVVIDSMMSIAFSQPAYILYLGREKDRIKENIGNLEALFSSSGVRRYAPRLSEVARNEETDSKRQWTATMLQSAAGIVVKGATVESTQAGSRIRGVNEYSNMNVRPTLMVPDDLSARDDSAIMAEKRYNLLTTEILPMRQWNTLVFCAENLINRYSVSYKILKSKAKALANRKPTVPIPAVRGLVTEERTVNGIVKDIVVAGKCTWRGWNIQRVQDEIDTYGLNAFRRECQHEVELDRSGLFHKAYNDDVHPISYSQFGAVYGSRDAWKDFYKIVFNDWARTKTKYHANVAGYFAVSSANSRLPGMTFLVPMSFPAETQPADVAIRLLSELTPYAFGENGNRTTWKQLADEAWKRTNAQKHFETIDERLSFEKNYYSKIIPKYSRKVLQAYSVRSGVMSHSEDKVREIFNDGFGFNFDPSNPGKLDGLEAMEAAMRIDYNEPHPFGKVIDGEPAKGYTRFFVLCPDDVNGEAVIVNGVETYPPVPYPEALQPDELHDSDLFRYQMCNRRFRPPKLTESGEMIDEPQKTDDDFGQSGQMVYFSGLLRNIKLSPDEKQEYHVNPAFRQEAIERAIEAGASDEDVSRMNVTRIAQINMPKVLKGKKVGGRFARFQR